MLELSNPRPRRARPRLRRGRRPAVGRPLASLRWLLVTAALAGSPACATPRLPSGVAARPLTLPAGDSQLLLGLGGAWRPRPDQGSLLGGFGYRYGLTDRWAYELPIVFGYRFGGDDQQLAVSGGLMGLRSDRRLLDPADDPRQPRDGGAPISLVPGARLSARLRLGARTALVAAAQGSSAYDFAGFYAPRFDGNVAFLADPADALSIGLQLSVALEAAVYSGSADERSFVVEVPLWWHLSEVFDLTLAPRFGYLQDRLSEENLSFGAILGFDLHFR